MHRLNDLKRLYISAPALNTSVSGVRPYSNHSVRVRAVNTAGSAVSGWTNFTTLPAPPSRLGAISIEPVTSGHSVILSWSAPAQPNGRILNYAVFTDRRSNTPVYDGPNRLFEWSGLDPYTEYGVRLEACTVAGCTRSPWQRFVTSQAPPANQRPPSVLRVNDSSVQLAWGRPTNTHGQILTYKLRRRTLFDSPGGSTGQRSGNTGRDADYETIYTTTNTTPSYFTYLDAAVLPFTRFGIDFSYSFASLSKARIPVDVFECSSTGLTRQHRSHAGQSLVFTMPVTTYAPGYALL